MSLVVSDTSPIRALAHLRQVELLQNLSGDIHVPPAVASELRNPPFGLPTVNIGTFGFLLVSAPRDQRRVEELLQMLDLGESEALEPWFSLDALIALPNDLLFHATRFGTRPNSCEIEG